MRTIAAAVLAAGFCLSGHAAPETFIVLAEDGSPVPDAVISSGRLLAPGESSAVMDQVDKAFAPHVLAVPVGASVDFPNSDQIRHHVYSFSEPKSFELRLYSGVPESPIVFDAPGIVVVGCNIHDNMLGYIYVSPRERWTVTSPEGEGTLELSDGSLYAWHPKLSLDAQMELAVELSTLEADDTGRKVIRLDIPAPDPYPQAVKTRDRDKFKRYLDF